MIEMKFRPLTEEERQAILRMLSLEFRGKADLVSQVEKLQISQLDETLYKLCAQEATDIAQKRKTFGLPIEAVYQDKDGGTVYVDLFADEHNKLSELEVWKGDGSSVLTPFTEAQLTVRFVKTEAGTRGR